MQIENITLGEYFELEDTSLYDIFIDVIKPRNYFAGRTFDVSKLTFDEFHSIISIFNSPSILNIKNIFVHLYKVHGNFNKSSDDIFLEQSVFDFFRAKKFITIFIKEKLQIESKLLFTEPDARFLEIGGDEILKPFSTMITKVSLGKQFGIDPYEIGCWKYSKVINILATNNALMIMEKKYNAK